jgi:tRNA-(ms[2]io[6]A)-hydroxylase
VLDLKSRTPSSWLDVVFSDFDAFVVDHAACERKASATGMSLVVKYPDKEELLEPMIEFAKEELEHFHIVFRLVQQRGLRLAADYKDAYVNGLRTLMRSTPEELFLDRLLVAGIVEARGCERLLMVAEAMPSFEPAYKSIYDNLARAESRHHALFFRLARRFFSEQEVDARATFLLDAEAALVERLPHEPRVH